jgi:hypothetical protein
MTLTAEKGREPTDGNYLPKERVEDARSGPSHQDHIPIFVFSQPKELHLWKKRVATILLECGADSVEGAFTLFRPRFRPGTKTYSQNWLLAAGDVGTVAETVSIRARSEVLNFSIGWPGNERSDLNLMRPARRMLRVQIVEDICDPCWINQTIGIGLARLSEPAFRVSRSFRR